MTRALGSPVRRRVITAITVTVGLAAGSTLAGATPAQAAVFTPTQGPVIVGNGSADFTPPVGTTAMEVTLGGAAGGGGSAAGAGSVVDEIVRWNDPTHPPTFLVGTSAAPTGSQPVPETGVTYGSETTDYLAPGSSGGNAGGAAGGNPSFLAVVPPSGTTAPSGDPVVHLSGGVVADVLLAAAGGGGAGGQGTVFIQGAINSSQTYYGGNGGSCATTATAGQSVTDGTSTYAGGAPGAVQGAGASASPETSLGWNLGTNGGGGGGGGGGLSNSSEVGGSLYSGLSGGAPTADGNLGAGGGGGGDAGDGFVPSTYTVVSSVESPVRFDMAPRSTTYPGAPQITSSGASLPSPECAGQNPGDGFAQVTYLNGVTQAQASISQGATDPSGDATFSVSLTDGSGTLLGSADESWFYYTVLEGTCAANQAYLTAGGVSDTAGSQPTVLAQNDISGTGTNPFTFTAPVSHGFCLVPYADTLVPAGTGRDGQPLYVAQSQTVQDLLGGTLRWAPTEFTPSVPVAVTVNVSGSETYGSTPSFTSTNDAPSGVTLSGTLSCTSEGGGTSLSGLGTGTYTLDGLSCSGLSAASGYSLSYVGVSKGFVVSPARIDVNVSGSETYDSSSPSFTYTDDAPSGVTLSGTLSCTSIPGRVYDDGGTVVSVGPTPVIYLNVGSYTLEGSSCSGLSSSDSTDYVLSYVGNPNGFVVNPATLTVTVSGAETYGSSSPSFTYTTNAPYWWVGVSGTLNCTSDGGGTLLSDLAAGNYTVDGTSCSGLSPSNSILSSLSDDYVLAYVGKPGGFVVHPAAQTITFTSTAPAIPTYGGNYTVAATGGDSGNPVTFTVDASSTPDACHISGTTVRFTAVGTCVIDANQDGNANYLAAGQVQQSFAINQAPLTVTAPSLSVMWDHAIPTLMPSYRGLTNGDTATKPPAVCSTTATQLSAPGSYSTTCSASDPDYAVTYVPGTLQITPPSAAFLESLVSSYATNPSVAVSLNTKLAHIAQAPNARAKAGMLNAFSNALAAQTGKSFTAQEAALLREGANFL